MTAYPPAIAVLTALNGTTPLTDLDCVFADEDLDFSALVGSLAGELLGRMELISKVTGWVGRGSDQGDC